MVHVASLGVLASGFKVGLEGREVEGHLPAGLAPDHERHDDAADPVPLEVDRDGQPGPVLRQRHYGQVDERADRPVGAADRRARGGSKVTSRDSAARAAPPIRRVVTQTSPT